MYKTIVGVSKGSKIDDIDYKMDSHAMNTWNLFREDAGVELLCLRCFEKRGKFLGARANFRRWVGKGVGCDGDDLSLFSHLGKGRGVLKN